MSHLSVCFSHCLHLSIECIQSLCLYLPLKSSLILWQSPSNSMFELLPCRGIYVFIEFAFLTCKKTSVAKADAMWKYHLPAFIPEKKTGSVPSGIATRTQRISPTSVPRIHIPEMCSALATGGLRRRVGKGPDFSEASGIGPWWRLGREGSQAQSETFIQHFQDRGHKTCSFVSRLQTALLNEGRDHSYNAA